MITGGISAEDYQLVKAELHKENINTLKNLTLTMTPIFLCLGMVGVFCSDSVPLGLLSILLSVILLAIYIWSKRAKKIGQLELYLFIILGLLYGIAAACMAPDRNVQAFLGMLILMPLIYTLRPKIVNIIVLSATAVFIAVTLLFRNPSVFYYDIVNAIVFMIGSIATTSCINRIRLQRFIYAYENDIMAHHDILTGLYNRNSYQEKIDSFALVDKTLPACIFIDVNGLHEYNDTYGHNAGDEMLRSVAGSIIYVFGKENSYRLGGDEFVVLSPEVDENSLKAMITRMIRDVNSHGYNIACGYSLDRNGTSDIISLIKEAETNMYINKAEFYTATGKDRRRIRI